MGIMDIVAIIVGVVLIAIAALSISASFRCLRYIDYDIAVLSITASMCGIAAILAGILFR